MFKEAGLTAEMIKATACSYELKDMLAKLHIWGTHTCAVFSCNGTNNNGVL